MLKLFMKVNKNLFILPAIEPESSKPPGRDSRRRMKGSPAARGKLGPRLAGRGDRLRVLPERDSRRRSLRGPGLWAVEKGFDSV